MVSQRIWSEVAGHLAWLVVSILAFAPAAGASKDFPPKFEDAVQDGKGMVWAINRWEGNHLFTFDGKDWRSVFIKFPSVDEAMPMRLAKTKDGTVMGVWKLGEERVGVTQHRVGQSRIVSERPGSIPGSGLQSELFLDSRDHLWFSDSTRGIHCVGAREEDSFRYELKPEAFLSSKRKRWDGYNVSRMVEDEKGRVWVWTNGASAASNYASIRGVLLFEGREARQIEGFEGIKGQLFSGIAQKAPGEMWVGVPSEGLFILNTETWNATPVEEPAPGAFQRVQEIFQMGGEWHVVGRLPDGTNTLWRLRGEKWESVVERLDVHGNGMAWRLPRYWVQCGEYFLLQASGHGPWVIPKTGAGAPVLLDWRSGFPVEASWGLFPFPDGKFLAIGHGAKMAYVPIPLPPKPNGLARITEVPIRWNWEIGVDQHLWAFFEGEEPLMEWDGTKWHRHSLPEGMAQRSSSGVACDRQGRVWVMPNGNKKAGFFESKKKEWVTFESWESAYENLQKQKKLPHWVGNSSGGYMVNVSADGRRMAFQKGWAIAYFDGSRWKEWKRQEIAPNRGSIGGAPFFDDQDRLSLNVGEESWNLTDSGAWVKGTYEDRYAERYGFKSSKAPIPPPRADVTTPWASVYDNHGNAWVTERGGGLAKYVGEDRAMIFAPDVHSPFIVPRIFQKAWVDPRGNLFLQTASNSQNYWMVAAGFPLPKTSLKVRKTEVDGVELTMKVETPGKARVYWRIDDGPWQSTSEEVLILDSIPSGKHRVTAYAVDEELQKEAIPGTASFKITVDPVRQIKRLVKQLEDPDYNRRRAAVAGLAMHRTAALPALKAARAKASDDLRWWIDATIQQIERAAQRAKENGAPVPRSAVN